MKICIYNLTTGLKFGGIETFTIELAKVLAEKGVDVYLFTGKGEIPLPYFSFKVERYLYLPLRYIPSMGKRFKKLISRLTFGFFSFRDLCRHRFDIIYIQKPFDMPIAILAKAITGSKIIFSSHGKDFYFGDRLFAKCVDGVFSCSSFNAKEIWERYRLKAKVIYNGCNIDLFKPRGPDRELKEKFRLRDSPVILSAGRLVNWKRIDMLINALPLLKTQNFRVIICGDGEEKSRLLNLSRVLGVEEKVIWTGAILHEELPRYLSLASVFVLPSISESFGMSICEAMAMGIPVVASRNGGVPEVVEDRVNGLLIDPGDIKRYAGALSENIDILLSDKDMRISMGREARLRVERMFTWDKVADRVLEGYKELCAS